MDEHFYFGGGAAGSTMHPVVLALTLLTVALVLALPRRHTFAPFIAAALLTPAGAQLYLGGFHFFVPRIVLLAALCRLIWAKVGLSDRIFPGGLTLFDRTFFLWAFCRAVAFVALHKSGGAVTYELAFWLDTFGAYILFRYAIRDHRDVLRAVKVMVAIVALLGVCMLYEHLTRFNVFNLIRTSAIVPWLRDDHVRAQGPFAQSITAGCFGATLLPLSFWLWKRGGTKALGLVGLAAATVVTVSSNAGTPASALMGAGVALALWPIRKHMRTMRWGIALTVIALALAMKAPVWYLIERLNFVGGHSWDRAFLMDQFSRHIGTWWLFGTSENASWGVSTWDMCSQFVAEAGSGGLVTLVLFTALVCQGFGMIGRARKMAEGDKRHEWLFWCLGATLFAHIMAFQGVSYFDQSRFWWYAYLAVILAATSTSAAPARPERSGSGMESPTAPGEFETTPVEQAAGTL